MVLRKNPKMELAKEIMQRYQMIKLFDDANLEEISAWIKENDRRRMEGEPILRNIRDFLKIHRHGGRTT